MSLKLTVALYAALIVTAVCCAGAQDQESNGLSGKIRKIGDGVTPPRPIRQTDPEFSDQARRAHFQGTCILGLRVGEDGMPRSIKIIKSLGMGLDEKEIETVRTWKFDPARNDGKRVPVEIAV